MIQSFGHVKQIDDQMHGVALKDQSKITISGDKVEPGTIGECTMPGGQNYHLNK